MTYLMADIIHLGFGSILLLACAWFRLNRVEHFDWSSYNTFVHFWFLLVFIILVTLKECVRPINKIIRKRPFGIRWTRHKLWLSTFKWLLFLYIFNRSFIRNQWLDIIIFLKRFVQRVCIHLTFRTWLLILFA